jgi:hypothetical protein
MKWPEPANSGRKQISCRALEVGREYQLQDFSVVELDRLHSTVNLLNAPELFALKWFTMSYVNFTSI